jgi:FkbM family methyltransferase
MMKNSLIIFFRFWARSGLALGWLYQAIDKYAYVFKNNKRVTQILGDTNIDCDLQDHIQRQIYFFGAYEPIESFLLQNILEENDIVVDAGANIGFYTLLMAQKVKTGKIFGFEPVPKNFATLKHNISSSPHQHKVSLQNNGLWHEKNLLQFSLDKSMEDNIGSFTAGKVENALQRESCAVFPLDEFCQSFSKLDFIKMDIEGAELSALRGAQKTIERLRPQFMIEINRKACERFGYSPDEIFLFFKKLGYHFYQVGDVAERSRWIDGFAHIEQANVFVVNEKRQQKILKNWDSKEIKKHFISLQH